ncbi:MAG: YcgL domain-containing protein [Gammaproteobacteria bacterium]|nr:YcgL domain-containing protein [Gammaproteobacteria bacterium]
MNCVIYKSTRKSDTYIYILEKDKFDVVPQSLFNALGRLEWIMELELYPEKKLALGDAAPIMQSLQKQGFYLQLPRI